MLTRCCSGGLFDGIPWAAVEGNHDGESGLSYAAVQAKMLTMHGSINRPNPSWLGKPLYGHTNFVHSVLGPLGGADAANNLLTLYFVDSNAYSPEPELSGGGYDWVHEDQIAWFVNESSSRRAGEAARGRGQPPALAWQHIPLPQHKTLQDSGVGMVGEHHEPVCSPNVDSGMALAYGESGDVKAVTVGHDHTNDWCSSEPVEGVYLCYDGHMGYGSSGYGRADMPIRARVFHASRFGAAIHTYKHVDPLCGGCAAGGTPIVDMQLIFGTAGPVADVTVSLTDGNPACPAGYATIHTDLNKGAGGKYSFLCVLPVSADSAAVVQSLGVASGTAAAPPVCELGWTQVAGNLKQGTSSKEVQNLCLFKVKAAVGDLVVAAVAVAQGAGAACAPGFEPATGDISGGVGLPELLCVKYEIWNGELQAALGGSRLPATAGWSATLKPKTEAAQPAKSAVL